MPHTRSLHPGLSGDGCVVAYYSVPPTGNEAELVAFDRCASTPATEVIARVPIPVGAAAPALSPPALSIDGSVIAVSTGAGVVRYTKPDTVWTGQTIVVPPGVAPSATVVAPIVDVSDNGSTIVFAAGPATPPSAPNSPSNIFRWVAGPSGPPGTVTLVSPRAGGTPANGSSTAPSISADGRFVVYQSDSTDLAAAGVPTVPPATGALATYVVLLDLGTTPTPTPKVLTANAARPVISGDGSTVAYDTSTDVHLVRSTSTVPFETVAGVSLSTGANGAPSTKSSVSGPALSTDGGVAVFDSTEGATLVTETAYAAGTHVFARTVVEVTPRPPRHRRPPPPRPRPSRPPRHRRQRRRPRRYRPRRSPRPRSLSGR